MRSTDIRPGDEFCRLVVTSLPTKINGRHRVTCDCSCGSKGVLVLTLALITNNTRSCGCLQREKLIRRNSVHGEATRGKVSPELRCWRQMIHRCYDSTDGSYADYGERGIRVCANWLNSFASFLIDMGRRPSNKHSIDRIDNDGNYEPGNCRWATRKEQNNNSRHVRWLTLGDQTKTMSEWAAIIGISVSSLSGRLDRMGVEKALTMPVQSRKRRSRG